MKRIISNVYYSFPFQLLILHLRSNHFLLLIWVLTALFIEGWIANKLGIKYLFLNPEYLGEVNIISFFFVGLAFGGFLMAWNLATYLLSSQYFPFLASLSKPFTKFSLNNAIIPLTFIVYYLIKIVIFEAYYEYLSSEAIFRHCLAFVIGIMMMMLFYHLYFFFTNRDISFYEKRKTIPPNLQKQIAPGRRGINIEQIKQDEYRWKVKTYLNERCRPRIVRSVAHYDARLLNNIFRQNHLNALIVQLFSIVLLMLLGALLDSSIFRIPAAASVFIFASILVAMAGAITYWFHEWRITILILILLLVNMITSIDSINQRNRAYGLDYINAPAEYSYEQLEALCLADSIQKDKQNTIEILNNWQDKIQRKYRRRKPKMVFICSSGGGLKAGLWSMTVTQELDSLLNGKLLDHTALITGASGGMMGMTYLRELYYQQQIDTNINLYHHKHHESVTNDLINPIAFTIVANDLFMPWSAFQYKDQRYQKDRGYIFEEEWNKNTLGRLDKPLYAYRSLEQQALMPMLFLTPSIVNDARRLIISPQGVSYMMKAPTTADNLPLIEVDAVDFGKLFQEQRADSLRFLSAVRMNATFPYVLPNVHLPTNPEIEVLDAGFTDNFGMLGAMRFIQVFKDWIAKNTDGVIILQISSGAKIEPIEKDRKKGIIESIFNPLGIAGLVVQRQEYEQDNIVSYMSDILGEDKFHLFRFIYRPTEIEEEAAISFHITKREQHDIKSAFKLERNQKFARQLISLMNE